MKILFILLLILPITLLCDDLINLNNGTTIKCKILSDSSNIITYEIYKNKRYIIKKINRSDVKSINFNIKKISNIDNIVSTPNDSLNENNSELHHSNNRKLSDNKDSLKNTCITLGFLCGGGSLIGFDFEKMVYKNLGIQIGGGFLGYGCGINIHTDKNIHSNFFSFSYLHQGIGYAFQELIGPSFTFRFSNIALQIGIAKVLSSRNLYSNQLVKVNYILIYSAGLYF